MHVSARAIDGANDPINFLCEDVRQYIITVFKEGRNILGLHFCVFRVSVFVSVTSVFRVMICVFKPMTSVLTALVTIFISKTSVLRAMASPLMFVISLAMVVILVLISVQ